MRTTIFTIDRAEISVRAELVDIISGHLLTGEIVQVEDRSMPAGERLRYTIQIVGDAGHVFDGHGRSLGVFADLDALVAHAEGVTAFK